MYLLVLGIALFWNISSYTMNAADGIEDSDSLASHINIPMNPIPAPAPQNQPPAAQAPRPIHIIPSRKRLCCYYALHTCMFIAYGTVIYFWYTEPSNTLSQIADTQTDMVKKLRKLAGTIQLLLDKKGCA
jgi:hypothetical protein